MNNPKNCHITVIVPVYNGEKYLDACLESIFDQRPIPLQVIVVDDGSTDSTPMILEKWAKEHPELEIITTENRGVSAARNTGVDHAKNDWVMFVDADDILHPQAVTIFREVAWFKSKPCVQVICAGYINSDKPDFIDEINLTADLRFYTSEQAVANTLYQKQGFDPGPWSKLIRTDLIKKTRFREDTRYEDLDIICRLYDNCESTDKDNPETVAKIDSALYFYRRNPKSFINSLSQKRLDVLRVTDDIEQYVQKRYPQLIAAARDRRFSANCNMFAVATLAGWHDEAKKCWNMIRRYRWYSLTDPRTRLKSKLGALASLLGKKTFLKLYKIKSK